MWLLNATNRTLEHFTDETEKYGRYAILSHVWKEDEVTFQDVQNRIATQKAGYSKIEQTCKRTLEDNLQYCWIDTCCIDKTSSAELSEAINSMYRWYSNSKVCYAYLYDVPCVPFKAAEWFTRGWTLQELIAPGFVEFYDSHWQPIGTKIGMVNELAEITRIDHRTLRDRTAIVFVSVAARMAWAANRKTKRTEDRAYSLMGIFDVQMPMLYGEGTKAFERLQEEIIKSSTDHSLFVWRAWDSSHSNHLFAPDPYGYRDAHSILSWASQGVDESFQLSNKGLRISLPVLATEEGSTFITAILNCRFSGDATKQIALRLRKQPHGMIIPTKNLTSTVCQLDAVMNSEGAFTSLRNLDRKHLPSAKWVDLMVLKEPARPEMYAPVSVWTQKITIQNSVHQLTILKAWPGDAWDPRASTMTLVTTGASDYDRGYVVLGEKEGKKKFSLAFGQEINSGRTEPRVWLSRHNAVPDTTAIFDALKTSRPQESAKAEFKKGSLALLASVERHLTATGDLEYTIKLYLEHESNLFKWSHLVQDMHANKAR